MANEPGPGGTLATAAVDRLLGPQRAEYLHDAQLLIAACRDLITETGGVDPPVSLILKRAGLGSRAFYRLFPSKHDLLMAVLEAGTEALQASIRSRLADVPDPAARIHAWIDTFVDHTTTTPADGTASLILDAPASARSSPMPAQPWSAASSRRCTRPSTAYGATWTPKRTSRMRRSSTTSSPRQSCAPWPGHSPSPTPYAPTSTPARHASSSESIQAHPRHDAAVPYEFVLCVAMAGGPTLYGYLTR